VPESCQANLTSDGVRGVAQVAPAARNPFSKQLTSSTRWAEDAGLRALGKVPSQPPVPKQVPSGCKSDASGSTAAANDFSLQRISTADDEASADQQALWQQMCAMYGPAMRWANLLAMLFSHVNLGSRA
jgi:hypothetical protein